MDLSIRHYLRDDVSKEISRFCSGRWVAAECYSRSGRRIFYRYWGDGAPLTISEPADVKKLVNKLGSRKLRTIYGSANIYRRLDRREDLSMRENILMSTPSWDVDGSLDEFHLIKEAAKIIIDALKAEGVEKSLYLIWSGRGLHIHLNEKAISEEIWKKDPLRVSFAIVEYALRKVRKDLMRVCEKSKVSDRRLKVENIIDVQRVFTAPLSLHRELDLVAVTVNPDDLDEFELEWAEPDRFKYWRNWHEFEEGEADEISMKALEQVKGDERTRAHAEEAETSALTVSPIRSVGRFQVMGLLQAARYYVLRGDLNLAKSFGLNRAIFYAWAKKRGSTVRRAAAKRVTLEEAQRRAEIEEKVGDEIAYRASGGWFKIGDQVQRPVDFDRQIAARFGKEFERYWKAAITYVKSFPEAVLKSQREFYQKAYLPVRDRPEAILSCGKSDRSSSK